MKVSKALGVTVQFRFTAETEKTLRNERGVIITSPQDFYKK
jgi:hypothetical protein